MIKPSLFNRRITVKRAIVVADDAFGSQDNGYDTRFTSWASVEEMSTQRKAYYGLDLFTTFFEIVLRYSTDRTFDTADLIFYGSQILSVQDARLEVQGYKRFWRLICIVSNVN